MIILGEATIGSDGVQIKSPSGFNTVSAVRLTNYSGDVITLVNINGVDQSVEYLMPLQQMVYPIATVQTIPVLKALSLGNNVVVETVLVEWSTDPLEDFQGTYPVALTEVGVTFLQARDAVSAGNLLALPLINTTYTVPAAVGQRSSVTVINAGTTNIEWSSTDGTWGTHAIILPSSSRTINANVPLYFRTAAINGLLEWFAD